MVRFTLSNLDAVEYLGTLDDESLDLVLTDPPYESLEKHRKRGTTTRLKHSKASSNDWFDVFPNHRFEALFVEVFRVLRPDRHFYMMCDDETSDVAIPIGKAAGFKYWKRIVWDKMKIGMGYHYRARYEFVLFFEKGKRPLNDRGIPDVLTFERVHRGYPAEKPVALMAALIQQSTQPGEVVADPFMGSGSTGVAALQLGRRFLGNDKLGDAVRCARVRLEPVGVTKLE